MFELIKKKRRPTVLPMSMWDDMGYMFTNLWSDFNESFGDNSYNDENGNMVYEMEVPGFDKENLKVEVSKGILSVKGKRKEDSEKSMFQNSIHKQITIGDLEPIDAVIKNGILRMVFKLPVKPENEIKEIKLS